MGQSHRLHCEKGPAEAVLPSPAEEVQPATGAAETILLYHHLISPLHINNCLVQLSYQIWPQKTTEGSPDCWANHWYNPPYSPRTVLVQSEQKGWQNHSGPLTSSTLPLWTVNNDKKQHEQHITSFYFSTSQDNVHNYCNSCITFYLLKKVRLIYIPTFYIFWMSSLMGGHVGFRSNRQNEHRKFPKA